MITLTLIAAASILFVGALTVKVVQPEGDHTSYLVMAPYPTLRFAYRSGEEGAWERDHPGKAKPWWVRGSYMVLLEITSA